VRLFLIVLDSVGIGEAPDAADYGDVGSATLQHTAEHTGGLALPTFEALGLGNIPALITAPPADVIRGVEATDTPRASFGAMRERSQGKDTITGHWELAGLDLNPGFHLFPATEPSFPEEITGPFVERTGRGILGRAHRRHPARRALRRLRDRPRTVQPHPRRPRHRPPLHRPARQSCAHQGPRRLRVRDRRSHPA